MSTELHRKINSIFSRHFLIPSRHIRGFRYLEDLGITQPEKLQLLNCIEEVFQVEISEADGRRIRTVGDTFTILDKYLLHSHEQRKAS